MKLEPQILLKLMQALIVGFLFLSTVAVILIAFKLSRSMPTTFTVNGQSWIHPALWAHALFFLGVFIWQGLGWLFFKFIQRVRQGELFDNRNIRDLRRIGLGCLALGGFKILGGVWNLWGINLWYGSGLDTVLPWLSPKPDLGPTRFNLDMSDLLTSEWMVGFLLLTFAEVLREGMRLRESETALRQEQELTI